MHENFSSTRTSAYTSSQTLSTASRTQAATRSSQYTSSRTLSTNSSTRSSTRSSGYVSSRTLSTNSYTQSIITTVGTSKGVYSGASTYKTTVFNTLLSESLYAYNPGDISSLIDASISNNVFTALWYDNYYSTGQIGTATFNPIHRTIFSSTTSVQSKHQTHSRSTHWDDYLSMSKFVLYNGNTTKRMSGTFSAIVTRIGAAGGEWTDFNMSINNKFKSLPGISITRSDSTVYEPETEQDDYTASYTIRGQAGSFYTVYDGWSFVTRSSSVYTTKTQVGVQTIPVKTALSTANASRVSNYTLSTASSSSISTNTTSRVSNYTLSTASSSSLSTKATTKMSNYIDSASTTEHNVNF